MRKIPSSETGGVLVFAVLLLAAGVFVLTGIAQLAATQAVIGQNEWQVLQRRNTLDNSRSMARQFMLARMFNGVVATNVGYTNATLGAFSLSPVSSVTTGDYWTTPSASDTNLNLKINPYTLMERGGFYRVVVPGKLSDGTVETDWNFQVRTRSPVAAGYSFVQQWPAENNPSAIVPSGVPFIDMRSADQFSAFPQIPRMPVSSVTATNAQDTNGYVGYFSVPLVPGGSSYGLFTGIRYEPLDSAVTALQIVLDLSDEGEEDLNSVVLFNMTDNTATYTNTNTGVVYTDRPVRNIVLEGADTPIAKPLHVVVGPGITNTTQLVLSNNNERLVYFNRQKTSNDGVPFTVVADPGASRWRLGLSVARSPVQFQISALEVTGGLRTDGTATFPGGIPALEPELTPEGLDYIADRMMWLEDYQTP